MNAQKVSYLAEVVKTIIDKQLSDIHTCLPAQVEKYDYSTHMADVKPLLKKTFKDGEILSMPVIPNVPVQYPRTPEAILHLPLNKGDTGIVLFSERSLDVWLSKGGDVETGDPRKFDLTDAIFIPGIYPFSENSIIDNNDDVQLVYRGTGIRIKKDGNIEIGGTSFKKLVNDEFVSLFNDHTHLYTSPVHPVVPDIPTGAPIQTMDNSHLTSKVKAE